MFDTPESKPPPLPSFVTTVHPDAKSLTPPTTDPGHPYGFKAEDGHWYLHEYKILLKVGDPEKGHEITAISKFSLHAALRKSDSEDAQRMLAHGCVLFDGLILPLNDNVLKIAVSAIPVQDQP